ncbi:hypothetical protein [Enterococcus sp. AZ007]|uniref:hypothetical protein n=1 Tax=Enterococcus sp. AZ007 TaxID=2774839 RepID=UPI003F259EA0
MLRDDIDKVIFQQPGNDRLSRASIGGVSSFNTSEIVQIDFSEETKVCRLHHENGSMTIIANSEFLMLRTKSKEEEK